MPPQGSTLAGDVDALYWFLIVISVIASLLVIVGMFWFLYSYKRKSESEKTAYITHNYLAEFLWSFIPLVLFIVSFAWGWKVFHDLRTAPDGAYEVFVKAKKWGWDFEYKNGMQSPGELVVPVGVPIKLLMRSQDVLHSFYVPSFRIKQDLIPGRYTTAWFEATREGNFRIFCTEYCGLNHSGMIATVKVVSQKNFDAWMDGKVIEKLTPVQIGAKAYKTRNCNGCHSVDGSVLVGPSFKGLFGATRNFNNAGSAAADENYIRESILNPGAKVVEGYQDGQMPAYAGIITDEEIQGLIEFIKAQK
ncbi:MAG: cytochrome c oxidase subunit II [Bdellovibrionales bacterium]